ncbi:MAG TPA: hypothetical protein VNF07_04485 [Acidimicrobiales bacterium]|nr:hypothetical protein [Acidimicrobiales bacterium]
MRLAGGLVLALASAACFAASYAGQHHAAADLERLHLRHPLAAARQLLGAPLWLLGYLASWVGWGLYIAALALAPLSLVQAANAAAIALLVLAVRRRGAAGGGRGERFGALAAAAGLVMVLTTLREGNEHAPSVATVVVLVACCLVAFALALALAPQGWRGVVLGAGSGLSYGAGDVATKAAVLGRPLLVPLFLGCAALGFVALQLSYQRTGLLASAGLSALCTNAIPIAAGAALFGEAPAGTAALAVRCAGFAAVVCGAIAIAGSGRPAEVASAR